MSLLTSSWCRLYTFWFFATTGLVLSFKTASKCDDAASKVSVFASLAGSKKPNELTSRGNDLMVEDCWVPTYKSYGIKTICCAIVFPALKEKGKPYMIVSKDTVDEYLNKTAHEIAKKKAQNTEIAADDEAVLAISADLEKLLIETDPKDQTSSVAKTRGTSQYNGAHKERSDPESKEKEGRVEKANTSGYVGNYKGGGT